MTLLSIYLDVIAKSFQVSLDTYTMLHNAIQPPFSHLADTLENQLFVKIKRSFKSLSNLVSNEPENDNSDLIFIIPKLKTNRLSHRHKDAWCSCAAAVQAVCGIKEPNWFVARFPTQVETAPLYCATRALLVETTFVFKYNLCEINR